MKVKFLKDHVNYVKDEVVELNKDLANYLINCGVVIEVKEVKKK